MKLLAALAAVLAVGAGPSIGVVKVVGPKLPAVRSHTTVPILLPDVLATAGKDPKLYVTASGSKNAWSFELDGLPNCFGADACFIASFAGERGKPLPAKANLRLTNGDPAWYHPITCGASCAPASLFFRHAGVLYSWQLKDAPKNAKAVLARAAAQAIAAGPR
jgi:hypothetical protein